MQYISYQNTIELLLKLSDNEAFCDALRHKQQFKLDEIIGFHAHQFGYIQDLTKQLANLHEREEKLRVAQTKFYTASKNPTEEKKQCPACGSRFLPRHHRQKYCCSICSKTRRNKYPEKYDG